MPMYNFKCACGLRLERLTTETSIICPNCSGVAQRDSVNLISPVVAGGTPAEDIDKTVGRDADKRWGKYNDRFLDKKKAREDSGQHAMSAMPTPDGKVHYTPISKEDITQRKELTKVLEGSKVLSDL